MFKPFSFNTKYKQSYHKIATSEINHYNIKELDMHFFDQTFHVILLISYHYLNLVCPINLSSYNSCSLYRYGN